MPEAKRRRMVRGAVDRVGVSTRQMASTFGLSQSCVVKIMQTEDVKHDKRQKALHMSNEQETRTKRNCKKVVYNTMIFGLELLFKVECDGHRC